MTLISLTPIAALVALLMAGAAAAFATSSTAEPSPAVAEQPAAAAVVTPALAAAMTWLDENARRTDRLLVTPDSEAALVEAGRPPSALVDVLAPTEVRWRDVRYVVATPPLRAAAGPLATSALTNSQIVAAFGAGVDRVDILAVTPEGATLAAAAEQQRAVARLSFGAELVQNPQLRVSTADRDRLAAGEVDDRISAVLALLASAGTVEVSGFPVISGEDGMPARQVALASFDGTSLVAGGEPTPGARSLVAGFLGRFAPQAITVDGDALVLRYTHPTASTTG